MARREAVESSRIEGTITDLKHLVLFEADPDTAPPHATRRIAGKCGITSWPSNTGYPGSHRYPSPRG